MKQMPESFPAWRQSNALTLTCSSKSNLLLIHEWSAANFLQFFTHLFTLRWCVGEDWHPLCSLLPLTFNTTVYNKSYSWQANWGFSAGPLLWVRLKPFYHTTYPVMDVHSSKTVLSEASGLVPVTHHTLLNSSPLPACWPWVQTHSAACSRQQTNRTPGLLAVITGTHHYPES